MNDALIPELCNVNGRLEDTPDVFTLDLVPPPGYRGFAPGQFNMLYVPGAGEAAISISGDPEDSYRLVHTIRAVGDVTSQLRTRDGHSQVGVRGPFGKPWPIDAARGGDLIIVAGGIGMAPMRPVLYAALADRASYDNIYLLYGARTPRDILFQEQLMEWHRQGAITAIITVDAARPSWKGDVGAVTGFIGRIPVNPRNTVAMICGPEIMMRYAASELLVKGIPMDRIHVSMERNMKCATAFCGHCQLGPYFVCRDGPVFRYSDVAAMMEVKQF
ncbi:MAG: FAD/NAD(P)-binding protein [Halieaceae bacterium]|nr:FAD/NAD(P)-binding protein [Halieaceae bacterium]